MDSLRRQDGGCFFALRNAGRIHYTVVFANRLPLRMEDEMPAPADTPQPSSKRFRETPWETEAMPPGIPYIVGNEAAERFSYYGVIAILATFLTKYLRDASGELAPVSEAVANTWQHNFQAAVYAVPIVGAILSDWLFGKYRMIVSVSLLYCLGHAVLAFMDFPHITGVADRKSVV